MDAIRGFLLGAEVGFQSEHSEVNSELRQLDPANRPTGRAPKVIDRTLTYLVKL